jgi:hypothetical protein
MFFWFQNFLTWQFLVGKINENSKKNVNNKKVAKKLGINFFFFFVILDEYKFQNKSNNSNLKHINNSNIKFI